MQMQDASTEELCWERDMQNLSITSLETRNPHMPRRDLSGRATAMECPSQPDGSRASSSLNHQPSAATENEEPAVLDGKKVKKYSTLIFCQLNRWIF